MVLQHSLPICLTFVPYTGMVDLLPTRIWTCYITDKNAVWLTSITEWERALPCKVFCSAFKNILTNHLSKQYGISALEVLVLVIHRHSYRKGLCLHSSLALSTHRGISHKASLPCCPPAYLTLHTITCINTPHYTESSPFFVSGLTMLRS